jgi:glycerol-3-phosphate O-acyltransferase
MKHYDKKIKGVSEEVHRFFYRTYSAIHINGPAIDPQLFADAGVMVTCSHRSMADYYLLGMVLHDMGVTGLRFAAADNLTRLPILGPKFRAFGAFTIERDSAFNRSYINRLCKRIVSMLINDHDHIIVFPEGGRSYKGSMMEIKGGVLAAAILAQADNKGKNIYIFPISLSYEKLYELPYFDLLKLGKEWRKRTNPPLKKMLGNIFYFGSDILAFLGYYFNYKFGRKQGAIYVDYDYPVPVNTLVDINAHYSPDSRDEFFAHKNSTQILAATIREKLLSLYRIHPIHVVSYALQQKQASSREDLLMLVSKGVVLCRTKKLNTLSLDILDDSAILEKGIMQLAAYKALTTNIPVPKILKQSIVEYYAAALSG